MALSLVSMAAQAEEATQAAETEESNPGDNAVTLLDSGDAMTRGEWMHELVALFGLSLEESEYPDIYFPDIEGTTYFDDIMVATKYGFVDVEAGDNFGPDKPLTRETAVSTVNYYLGIHNDRETYTFSDSSETAYPDDAQVALEQGWVSLNDGKFDPQAVMSATEIQTIISAAGEILSVRNPEESSYRHEYEFANWVKELPSSAQVESHIDMETDERTLTISSYEGNLAAGDTFAFYYQDMAFVFAVKSVAKDNGTYTVVTEDAPDDAILKYEYVGKIEPDIVGVLPDDDEPVTLMTADGDTVTIGSAQLMGDSGPYSKTFKKSISFGSGKKGEITGSIKNVIVTTKVDGDVIGFEINGDVEVTSTLKIDFLDDPSAAELRLCGLDLGPLGYAGLVMNLKAQASLGYFYQAHFSVGADYKISSGVLSKDSSWKASDECYLFADGDISARIALTAYVEFGKSGAHVRLEAGPTIKAGYKSYASGTPRRCLNTAGYLYAGFHASVSIKAPVTGRTLYSANWDKDFFNERNSPVRFGQHVEDGVVVSSCTRGKDAGTTSGKYSTPKYTTPSNSRYYASSVANASSTGYGGYGSSEPVVIWSTSDNGDGTVTVTGYSGNASILNIPETIDGKTVTKIANDAFKGKSSLRIVNIPNTITSIGWNAFRSCSNLASVQFGQNITEIGGYAFAYCGSLTAVNLPEGLTSMEDETFLDCGALTSAYIPSTLNECDSNYGPFTNCARLDSITFGEGIPKICAGLFEQCTGLTHIEIPDTVTSVGWNAFRSCSNLASVQFGQNITEIGGYAFQNAGLNNITIPDTITAYADGILQNCDKLVNAQLSVNALTIPSSMFSGCSSLQNIEIPNGVTEIKSDTFNGCSSLRNITMPDSVTKIGNSAFRSCAALTDLTWIPNAVTSIGSNAFENCTALISAELPDSVSSLDGSAFKGDASLTLFKGGANLQTVGANCFQDCTALTDVDFASGLTSIGNYAFQNCAALETIVLPDSVTSIGTYAFQKDAALKNVTLSSGLTQIPSYAFANCTSMTELEIPSGVTTIKDHAFYQDTKLKTFVIPASVSRIEDNAFSYPTSSTVYGVAGSYAESYARWAAFLDIAQYRKNGAMGPKQEIQWSYNPSAMSVTITGPISANDSVYVATYDANGKMLSMEVITSSGNTSQAGNGAKSIALFWLDSDFVPKSDKSVIHTF